MPPEPAGRTPPSFVRVAWATCKRELVGYFLSPLSYALAALFLIVQGYGFFLLIEALARSQAPTSSVLQYFFGGTFLYWLFLLFLVALLTMRLVAEERQHGTLEPLLTAPVRESAVATGKLTAALLFYVALWLPTVIYPAILASYARQPEVLELGPLAAGYLGTLLTGLSALALGLLCSTLARTQILAAALTFVLLVLWLLFGLLTDLYAPSERLRAVAAYLNLFQQQDELGRGILDSRRIVLHLSLALAFLGITARALGVRHGDRPALRRTLAESALALGLLVAVNVLCARHPLRGDLTRARLYALQPRTQALLAELGREKKAVRVTLLRADSGERSELFDLLRELVTRAERASSGAVQAAELDVDRDREKVRLLTERLHLDAADVRDGLVVVESGEQHKLLLRQHLGELERLPADTPPALGSEPPLRRFHGEEALAAAILTVTTGRTRTLCFVRGHGEAEYDGLDNAGLSELSTALRRENLGLRALDLADPTEGGAPARLRGCDLVTLVGPQRPLLADEAAALSGYLDGGGRLLLLLGALLDRSATQFLDTGLEPLLLRVGVRLGHAVATDPRSAIGDGFGIVVEQGYADHPITAPLIGKRTLWTLARPVHAVAATPESAAGWRARELVHTSDLGFGETDPAAVREGQLELTPRVDETGPVPLLVASESRATAGAPAGRVVVVGSAQMAWNDGLVLWNRDLLLHAAQWLTDTDVQVGIAAKEPSQLRLVVPEGQSTRRFVLLVLALPGLLLLLGALVLRARRR